MTTNRVTTYSADQVAISFCGVAIDSGFAEGEFVSIEMASDDWALKVGADGEGSRAKTNNLSATMHIKLLQTSLGNNKLSQIRALDLAAPNGAGVGVFQVTDLSSGVQLAHASHAWIQKPPAVSRGKEGVEYDWTLQTHHMDLDPSGSPSLP